MIISSWSQSRIQSKAPYKDWHNSACNHKPPTEPQASIFLLFPILPLHVPYLQKFTVCKHWGSIYCTYVCIPAVIWTANQSNFKLRVLIALCETLGNKDWLYTTFYGTAQNLHNTSWKVDKTTSKTHPFSKTISSGIFSCSVPCCRAVDYYYINT